MFHEQIIAWITWWRWVVYRYCFTLKSPWLTWAKLMAYLLWHFIVLNTYEHFWNERGRRESCNVCDKLVQILLGQNFIYVIGRINLVCCSLFFEWIVSLGILKLIFPLCVSLQAWASGWIRLACFTSMHYMKTLKTNTSNMATKQKHICLVERKAKCNLWYCL